MEPFFEDDEQINQPVDPNWSIETLLAQRGIFYFKDIAEILQLNHCSMPREAKKLEDCDLPWLQARKETYRLADVCLVLPVRARRLKQQARLLPDSRETMGVYRDTSRRFYLVQMAVFL